MRNLKFKLGRPMVALSAILVASAASAQPYRIAWTRSNASVDIVQDTANDAVVLPNGHFAVVGSSRQPNGTYKGCVTIFNRNRAVVRFAEFERSGGGSVGFYHALCTNESLYVIGGGTEGTELTNPTEVIVKKLSFVLDIEGEMAGHINTAPGVERVTDAALDPNGNLYLTGIAAKMTGFETFVLKGSPNLANSGVFGQTAVSQLCAPQVTVNGIIAILIGLLTDNGPTVQSYSPAGGLNWSLGASNPTGAQTNSIVFTDIIISSYLYAATSWTREQPAGVFTSQGRIHKIDPSTGTEVSFGDTPALNGADMVVAADMASGQATGKRVNALFKYGNRGRVFSYNGNLAQTGDWISPMTSLFVTDLIIDPFDSLYASLCNNENIPGKQSFGAALNPANETRFSWGMSQTGGFLLPYMEQSNVIHNDSGDILTLRTDNSKMQLVKIEQAPVGVTDAYQPKSGKFFRPVLPVTWNDRYAGGAAITIVQQPAHGTMSMGANGVFNYTSAQGYVGPDSFKYRLTKAGLNTSTVTVNLNVRP